jgi:NAD(P)-dependent dehydrogenase (short-subunit alcohol dehydrogenase family)
MAMFNPPHVSVVTGASGGIGAASAIALAEWCSTVVIHYNQDSESADRVRSLIEERGGKTFTVNGDLRRREDAERLVDNVIDKFGQIDVLVNNAGSMIGRRLLPEIDEEFWRDVFDTNTSSVLWMTQAVAPHMVRRQTGAVINISSLAARNGGSPGVMAYAAAKAAVLSMTKSLAKELVRSGVRVNTVNPGIIATPFHERFSTEQQFNSLVGAIPQGRPGKAEEVAQVIRFLASPAASHIVGECIEVNGGLLMD